MSELNHRIYVVEVPSRVPECSNLPHHSYDPIRCCCAYDADSEVHAVQFDWVSVHQTDDHEDAVKTAKEYHRARVRQFWVSKTITQRNTITQPQNVIIPDAPMNDWTCLTHSNQHARAIQPPTCPECHMPMEADANIEAMNNPIDWSNKET